MKQSPISSWSALLFFLPCVLTYALQSNTAHAQWIGISNFFRPEGSRLFPQTVIFPRHPGKPDPRWKSFQWHYLDLASQNIKFRLYFYKEEDWIVQFAIPEIRREIEFLKNHFKFEPQNFFSYLLFNSQREFKQANIFYISEGVQGITSTTEATMAIPYWGDPEAFRHVSTHELVHQFQVQKIAHSGLEDFRSPALQLIPLWFIEGMAEYYSYDGIDPETQSYLRDLLLHPDPKREFELPSFFENGPVSFITIYKAGQAKIAFLEIEFGAGTTQRILEAAANKLGTTYQSFEEVVTEELKQKKEDLEAKWKTFMARSYQEPLQKNFSPLSNFETVQEVGETLDHFDLSPDGKLLAIRETEPLSGVTQLSLIPLDRPHEKIEIAKDSQPNLLSLYFLQQPNLTLGNNRIAYLVETHKGPEIEFREIKRKLVNQHPITLSQPIRIPLHRYGILQASSLALSPDGKEIALIGLNNNGWTGIFIFNIFKTNESNALKTLIQSFYTWKTLAWDSKGLLAAGNQTAHGKFNLFRITPDTGKVTTVSASHSDQLFPSSVITTPKKLGETIVFQSWETGRAQIHLITDSVEKILTDTPTFLSQPKFRNNLLYVLALQGGRFHLLRIKPEQFLNQHIPKMDIKNHIQKLPAWQPVLEVIASQSIQKYTPFVSSRFRTDQIMGYFALGNVFSLGATVSDLMRDYSITGEFSVLGNVSLTTLYLFLSIQRGRSTWHVGGYHLVQERLDNILAPDERIRTYFHREFGVLGAFQYPLSHFSFLDAELRLGGVKRSEYSDVSFKSQWEAENPGIEFAVTPIFRFGYDTILYEMFTGPLKGFGFLAEADTSFFVGRKTLSERIRLDCAQYFQLSGNAVLALQTVGGFSFGEKFGNPFLVSSDDILRAYNFGDERLRGNFLLAAKSEVRFPIGNLFGFQPLRGLVGVDWGTLFRKITLATQSIASSTTWGISLNLPPLSMNFLVSYPLRTAPGPVDRPVIHFTLRYLYL